MSPSAAPRDTNHRASRPRRFRSAAYSDELIFGLNELGEALVTSHATVAGRLEVRNAVHRAASPHRPSTLSAPRSGRLVDDDLSHGALP
jgi:hypothetical protein